MVEVTSDTFEQLRCTLETLQKAPSRYHRFCRLELIKVLANLLWIKTIRLLLNPYIGITGFPAYLDLTSPVNFYYSTSPFQDISEEDSLHLFHRTGNIASPP